jgi:hypothetical protein
VLLSENFPAINFFELEYYERINLIGSSGSDYDV